MSCSRMATVTSVVCILWMGGCSVRHASQGPAVFRVELREGVLQLAPPSLEGVVAAKPIPFSQILANQYGYNPWEQYVDLSPGMRLAVQRMLIAAKTADSEYVVLGSGRGMRVRNLTPGSEAFDQRARYFRLFYQTKFMKATGQPVRPAMFVWSNSPEHLKERTGSARENAGFPCGPAENDCLSFSGKTTVSPEVRIVVNQKPRYVALGSTVREVLRSDKAAENADLRLLRKFRNRMVPVTWEQRALVMNLPLVGDDEMSW